MSPERSKQDVVAQQTAEVLRLSMTEGKSIRAIARQLCLSRNTVRRMLGLRLISYRKTPTPRTSILDPHKAFIKQTIEDDQEIKAPGMLERLRPRGYGGGVTTVKNFLQRLRQDHQRHEAFLTLDFRPGAAVQIDWADFGFAIPGIPRRVSAFIMALCYSRYLYIEFTLSQAFGSFLRAMERGLLFFGGTTLADVFDNMKTVVISHVAGVPVFNQRFLAYAAARGFAVRACRPRKPHEKGRVERPVGFVRTRFWPGRHFASLLDLNQQAARWRDDFANNREHEETGKVPALVFKHEEQPRLKPLPPTPFDTDDIEATGITKQFRVRFDRNTYSVPPRLVSQNVTVRANDELVSVYLGPKQVALHDRCWDIGKDIELAAHRDAALADKPRAAAGGLPPGLSVLGDVGRDYFKIFAAGCRSINKEVVRLTHLCELFGESTTASAMGEVMKTGHVGAEYVEYVLRYKKGLTPSAPPLRLGDPKLDAISLREPDLSAYDVNFRPGKTIDPGQPPIAPKPPADKETPHE